MDQEKNVVDVCSNIPMYDVGIHGATSMMTLEALARSNVSMLREEWTRGKWTLLERSYLHYPFPLHLY